MASLNLSSNGPSISKSYESVVNAPPPSGPASNSPTYGQWAVFSVTTPLVSAFQQDGGGKESVLKVQSTGEGELVDLIDDFSDGRVQFGFLKVKDPNTSLPKHVLIGWCGEGVPERTKGYFTNYQAAVAKVLHGYHVQITARSDRDLSPEGIVQKVADASGSKYSAGSSIEPRSQTAPVASKPAFMPQNAAGGVAGFNPLSSSSREAARRQDGLDEDGWGEDAPPVTRTQLEKVQPAYKPIRVNMSELSRQQVASPVQHATETAQQDRPEIVKGAYQPVGKVDIAAIRKQAQNSGTLADDRPTIVKGAYEPVGKVDIAAIRSRAQPEPARSSNEFSNTSPRHLDASEPESNEPKSLAERSAAFSQPERLTSLPKPKVSNRFTASSNSFAGTKAPVPSELGFGSTASSTAAPVGASRTFADRGGKTPAQLWAEKKARQGGSAVPASLPSGGSNPKSPTTMLPSSGGEWKSGYAGKTWAPVQTTTTGRSGTSTDLQSTGNGDDIEMSAEGQATVGDVGSIRDKFSESAIMGAHADTTREPSYVPPPLDTSNKPNTSRGTALPGLAQQSADRLQESASHMPVAPPPQPRSPTPPTPESGSPIRVAIPVSRAVPEIESAPEEQTSSYPPVPVASLAREVDHLETQKGADEPETRDVGRAVASNVAASTFESGTAATAATADQGGKRAIAQYDYEKAEDNELELREGEHITNIEMVDEDWWMGQNSSGESGLFPSNYVELVADNAATSSAEQEQQELVAREAMSETAPSAATPVVKQSPTATALYDYEAGEDNELTFPEGAKITNVEFPDEDWWSGEYGNRSGLFPANYVQLDV